MPALCHKRPVRKAAAMDAMDALDASAGRVVELVEQVRPEQCYRFSGGCVRCGVTLRKCDT